MCSNCKNVCCMTLKHCHHINLQKYVCIVNCADHLLSHNENTSKIKFTLTASGPIVVHVITKDVLLHRFLRCVLLHITVPHDAIHLLVRPSNRPMCYHDPHRQLHRRVIRRATRLMATESDLHRFIILLAVGHPLTHRKRVSKDTVVMRL